MAGIYAHEKRMLIDTDWFAAYHDALVEVFGSITALRERLGYEYQPFAYRFYASGTRAIRCDAEFVIRLARALRETVPDDGDRAEVVLQAGLDVFDPLELDEFYGQVWDERLRRRGA